MRVCQLVLFWLATVVFSGPSFAEEALDVDAILKDMKSYADRLRHLQSEIEVSHFVPDEKVDRLDYDASLIIDFVRDEVAYHPYTGVLRGVVGTLQSRGGNSLDQALLLGYLLKTAGYDAQIAQGELTETDARRLLSGTRNAVVPQSLSYLSNELDKFVSEESPERSIKDTQLYQRTLAETESLLDVLDDADIELEGSKEAGKLVEQARNYFWIQFRESPSMSWTNLHPSFGALKAPENLTPIEYYEDSVPKEFQHRFAVTAWIEQWSNGKINKHRVMKTWTGPVANLIGMGVQYTNLPNGLNEETAHERDLAVSKTDMFFPMFNGSMAPGAKAFDLSGRTIDPDVLGGSGAAGIFKTVGDKFESAVEGIAAREDGKPILALHSMYLEFTFVSPDGEEQSRRRYVLPPRADYRDDQSVTWQLMSNHTYVINVGDVPIDYVASRALEATADSVSWLEFVTKRSFAEDEPVQDPDPISKDVPVLMQAWMMDQYPREEDLVQFRPTPGLIGIREGFHDAETRYYGVDVVFNQVAQVQVSGNGLKPVPQAALRRGVWDTVLESVPARLRQIDHGVVSSTVRLFELAREQGIDPIVVTDSETLGQLELDETALFYAQSDLNDGYVLVMPERVPDLAHRGGWWRVNVATGETLGVTADGYGAESFEYLLVTKLKGRIDTLSNGLDAIEACTNEPNMPRKMCCLMAAHANNVMGVAAGSVVSNGFGRGASRLWKALNTATGGVLPSVAPLDCETVPETDW